MKGCVLPWGLGLMVWVRAVVDMMLAHGLGLAWVGAWVRSWVRRFGVGVRRVGRTGWVGALTHERKGEGGGLAHLAGCSGPRGFVFRVGRWGGAAGRGCHTPWGQG